MQSIPPHSARPVSPVSHAAPARPGVVRVLTLNLHKGLSALKRRDVLSDIRVGVRDIGADLVFLQEVEGAGAAAPLRLRLPRPGASRRGRAMAQAAVDGSVPQYEYLADTIWVQHAYGRNSVTQRGHHGNAVLSKYPIRDFRNIELSRTGSEPRGLLHCRIDVPGLAQPLHALCVHLGLREAERGREIDRVCRVIHDDIPADAPLLLAGDFNDWRLRTHRRLREHLRLVDVHAEAAGQPARTFPARHPVLRLDRIYVRASTRSHVPMALPRRPWSHLSDHTPLAAEVTL